MTLAARAATVPDDLAARAAAFDEADPLARYRDAFIEPEDVAAYLDGNSLGRPLKTTREHLRTFVEGPWASRLIRSWDEGWMNAPTELGDLIGRTVLGAGAGQTVVGDSTSVMLYKLIRAAADARPDRREIVADINNFPTDRFIAEAIADERGLAIRWINPDPHTGVTAAQVRDAVGSRTAVVILSHVDYRSGFVADMGPITGLVHQAGALILWDLCHAAGAVELSVDTHGVDLAVGCTYKYLNGGPGAPAFAYVASALQPQLRQPIQGWMGAAEPFAMTAPFEPAPGIRRFISGTPPILGMLPMRDMLALIEQAGMRAIRAKSLQLSDFAIAISDELLAPLGVQLVSPRDATVRGSHISLEDQRFAEIVGSLWKRGVIPDFRAPNILRIGLSPLSTSYSEVAVGLSAIAELLSS